MTKQKKNGFCRASLIAFVLLPSLMSVPAWAGDNDLYREVSIHVGVLAAPCNISPEDQSIHVDFGTVGNKGLYNGNEHPSPFSLHLTDCDTSIAQSVRFTFNGTEEPTLPGMLAVDTSSAAQGIAIGIRDNTGKDLPVNKQSGTYPLTDGDMSFSFVAWLKATPEAIEKQSITEGNFSAQAILNLDYE